MGENCTINPKRAGLALGALFALCHLIWVAIVAAGAGDAIISWVQAMHFVQKAYTVLPLDAASAVIGIVLAFVAGAATGAAFALIWNAVGKKAA